MIRGVLFDLDGTLVNKLDDIASAMNRALRLHGLKEYAVKEYCYLVGNGARVLTDRAVGSRKDLAEAVLKDYQAYYETHNQIVSAPYSGIPELLRALRDQGMICMVLSNKPDADTRHVISHYFGDGLFALVNGQKAGVPLKPDPTAALAAAREAGLSPDEILYLGDTSVDVTCARRAGMHAVGVTWGFRERKELEEAGAEFIIDRPEETLQLIATIL